MIIQTLHNLKITNKTFFNIDDNSVVTGDLFRINLNCYNIWGTRLIIKGKFLGNGFKIIWRKACTNHLFDINLDSVEGYLIDDNNKILDKHSLCL